MDNKLNQEIKLLQKKGWHLCCGCIKSFGEGCMGNCTIEHRKRMGLSPQQIAKLKREE